MSPYFYNSSEKFFLSICGNNNALLLNEEAILLNSDSLSLYENIVTTTNLNSVAQKGVFIMTFGINPFESDWLHCLDIHKSLLPTINKYIKDRGITRETMYPQEEVLAKQAFEQSLIVENFTTKE